MVFISNIYEKQKYLKHVCHSMSPLGRFASMQGKHVSLRSHGLTLVAAGAASGLIASLAVSALVLLAERVAGLPVGTFYLVLVSSISQQDYSTLAIVQGLFLHLLAGTVIGAVLSAPFAISKRAYRTLGTLSPAYGLAAGALVWAALFLPVTYWTMVPLLQSLDGQPVISQRAPIGSLFSVAIEDLLAMADRIVYTALAFNMFFGLLGLVTTRAFAGAMLEKKQVVL